MTNNIGRPEIVDRYALGRRIAEARVARDWSQQALAVEADVATSQVARWEVGYQQCRPTIDNLVRLADALGVSLDWLCGRRNALDFEHTGPSLLGLAGSMPPSDDLTSASPTSHVGEGGGVLDPSRGTAPGRNPEPADNCAL